MSIIGLFFVLCLSGQTDSGSKTYRDDVFNFGFSYPADWITEQSDSLDLLIHSAEESEEEGPYAYLNVSITEFPLGAAFTDIESLMEVVLPDYEEIMLEQDIYIIGVNEMGVTKRGSKDVYCLEVEGEQYGYSIYMQQHICLLSNELVVMSLTSHATKSETYKPVFTKIINSLSFD